MKRLLGRADAAEYLGMSVSTFDQLARPALPFVLIGRTEERGARWDRADLDAWVDGQRKIEPAGVSRERKTCETKTKASRSEARLGTSARSSGLVSDVKGFEKALAARTSGQRGKDDTWVFPSPKGGCLYRITNNGWRAARQAAGLPIRVHDLRHTFGERAADAGIPLDIRRSLLGHEHHDITLHYSAPGLRRLLEEAERIVRPSAGLTIAHCAKTPHTKTA